MNRPQSQPHSRAATPNPGRDGDIPFSRPHTPTLLTAQFAFVGLGEMGRRMATNLAKSLMGSGNPPLIVFNRSEKGVEEFKTYAEKKGLPADAYQICYKLEDVAKVSNMIITSLGGDDAVRDVFGKLYAAQEEFAASRQTIYVDTSTVYPACSGELERKATSKPNRSFIACPVFGVPRAAEKAELLLAISGDYFAKKIAAHALCPAIGKKVVDLGSNVERAMSFKLVGNALELGFIELISECFTLADQAGVGADKLVELIRAQHQSPALIRYSERISQNKFDATGGFTLAGGLADAKHVRQLADSHNVPMPTIDVAHQHMITARASGGDEMDWTALVGGQRIAAGLEPFAGKTRLEKWEGP